jgi:hypothetical protein
MSEHPPDPLTNAQKRGIREVVMRRVALYRTETKRLVEAVLSLLCLLAREAPRKEAPRKQEYPVKQVKRHNRVRGGIR